MNNDTICAVSTAHGAGAVALIRISGTEAFTIVDKIFKSIRVNKKISAQKAFTVHFGTITESNDEIVDEVLVSVFRAPHSYTGEDTAEITCHGSLFVQQKILRLLVQNGARTAQAGEFTRRAFLNGKMDLSQAEAVADLISTSSAAAHRVAVSQMRGGFTDELKILRNELLSFISLIELELDFSEEDVEFADRSALKTLISRIDAKISSLTQSFELGNVIKNGIPVAIVGKPNAGKSTLLNVLLNEDKALVSEIAGTTRDAIEDTISVRGILFRFIDTAGIRQTDDIIEALGVERSLSKIEKAEIVLYLSDVSVETENFSDADTLIERYPNKKWIFVANKSDKSDKNKNFNAEEYRKFPLVAISAKHKTGIDRLEQQLLNAVHYTSDTNSASVVTNARHYELLYKAGEAAKRVETGLGTSISGDFLAQDIREILNYIGEITGEITNDEILGNIFKNFCIGK